MQIFDFEGNLAGKEKKWHHGQGKEPGIEIGHAITDGRLHQHEMLADIVK